jgi:glycolate oxidase
MKMQDVSALEEIVGSGNVSTSASVCQTYSYSCFLGSDWVTKPDLVVIARTPEQVSQILKLANQHGIPVTPRGAAGQGGHGGPLKGGILLDLTPMEKIITIDKENMKAVAEAGCSFFKLSQELFKQGMMLPTTEYGPGPCVAASAITPVNAFGKTRYGRNIDLVEGFEVVLPDGEIIRVGSMAYADTEFGPYYRYITGPDLVGLFTQSNGALGIVTKVAYRCLKVPKHWAFHSYYWKIDQIEQVRDVLMEATSMEIFDVHVNDRWKYAGLEFVEQISILPEDCYFIVYFTANSENEKELEGKVASIDDLCKRFDGQYLPGIAESFFTIWPTFFTPVANPIASATMRVVMQKTDCNYMYIYDSLTYPLSWFPEIYHKLKELGEKYGIWGFPRFTVFDGFAMKSHTMCSQTWAFVKYDDPFWQERLKMVRNEFREWYGARGGTFQSMLPPLTPDYTWTNQPGAHGLLKRIKAMLDPNNILSPGSF